LNDLYAYLNVLEKIAINNDLFIGSGNRHGIEYSNGHNPDVFTIDHFIPHAITVAAYADAKSHRLAPFSDAGQTSAQGYLYGKLETTADGTERIRIGNKTFPVRYEERDFSDRAIQSIFRETKKFVGQDAQKRIASAAEFKAYMQFWEKLYTRIFISKDDGHFDEYYKNLKLYNKKHNDIIEKLVNIKYFDEYLSKQGYIPTYGANKDDERKNIGIYNQNNKTGDVYAAIASLNNFSARGVYSKTNTYIIDKHGKIAINPFIYICEGASLAAPIATRKAADAKAKQQAAIQSCDNRKRLKGAACMMP